MFAPFGEPLPGRERRQAVVGDDGLPSSGGQPPRGTWRGGWRQQVSRHVGGQAAAVREWGMSLQAAGHLLDWADGAASASSIKRHNYLTVRDGEVKHPMVHRLAHMGDAGGAAASNQNVARELANVLRVDCGFGALSSPVGVIAM